MVVALKIEAFLLFAVVAVEFGVLSAEFSQGGTQAAVVVELPKAHGQNPAGLFESAGEFVGSQQNDDELSALDGVEGGQAWPSRHCDACLHASEPRPAQQFVSILPYHFSPHSFVLGPALELPAFDHLSEEAVMQALGDQQAEILCG